MKSNLSKKLNGYWVIAFLLIAAKLCLHFFTNTNYELHRDEMLYFNMADHLSWGYASVPPVIGFLAFLVKSIFGYSVFGIRFIPALLGAASIYILAKIVRLMGGGIAALLIACTAFLLSTGFLLIGSLFTPNIVEQFLWLLISYLILKMTSENNPKQWLWIGILLGLAFLNKYSVLYLIAGFFIAILFSPNRKLLQSKYFFYSIGLGFLVILPNLWWQYAHNWPVVLHMKELKETQLDNMQYMDFFKDLISLNQVSVITCLFGIFGMLFLKKERNFQYLGIVTVSITLLFLLSGGKAYYIMGIVPLMLAAGGVVMEKYLSGKLRLINYAVMTSVLVVSLITLPFGLPVLPLDRLTKYSEKYGNRFTLPFSRWENGKVYPVSQVYADMTGWQEMTALVVSAYNRLSIDEQKSCTIFVEQNYGDAGAINFYARQYKLPEAITFLDSYTIWAPEIIPEGPIIYINFEIGELRNLYQNIEEIGQVNNPWFRENGLKVFLCKDQKANVPEIYVRLAREAKGVYRK